MSTQVITIATDGTVSGLQHKKGKGVDLRQFGHAEIERASLIEWDESYQCWTVNILSRNVCEWMVPRRPQVVRGQTLRLGHWQRTVGTASPEGCEPITVVSGQNDCWLGFDDYDDAVKAEVAFLDALRRRGVF